MLSSLLSLVDISQNKLLSKQEMPTINQLVRKPRKSKVVKSTAPALNVGFNSRKKFKRKQTHHKNVGLLLVLVQ
jgi:small subunit ribosomal protein S12